jgi:hypothetical protein
VLSEDKMKSKHHVYIYRYVEGNEVYTARCTRARLSPTLTGITAPHAHVQIAYAEDVLATLFGWMDHCWKCGGVLQHKLT